MHDFNFPLVELTSDFPMAEQLFLIFVGENFPLMCAWIFPRSDRSTGDVGGTIKDEQDRNGTKDNARARQICVRATAAQT